MGTCSQSHGGRSNQEISRASRYHALWKAGGDCRSDELSGFPGGEVDDRRIRAHGRRRDKVHLALSALSPAKSPWSKEEAMERRNFLGALTAASLGIALDGSLTEFAHAQSAAQSGVNSLNQVPSQTSEVEVSGN